MSALQPSLLFSPPCLVVLPIIRFLILSLCCCLAIALTLICCLGAGFDFNCMAVMQGVICPTAGVPCHHYRHFCCVPLKLSVNLNILNLHCMKFVIPSACWD